MFSDLRSPDTCGSGFCPVQGGESGLEVTGMRYVSWLFLCVVLIGGLSPLTAAPADGGPVSLHSIDVGMSNDIPLGALRDKTGYNPGLAAQVNFEVSQYQIGRAHV